MTNIAEAPTFTIDPIHFDPTLGVREGINKTGLTTTGEVIDWGLYLSNVPHEWKQTHGEGIKVAILDSGAPDHPDLRSAVVDAQNFTREPDASDGSGHSTFVGGIVGARANGFGVIGVAPKTELYFAKVLGSQTRGEVEFVNAGLQWALDQNVDIISMSLSVRDYDRDLHRLILEATKRGKFVICSSGNYGPAQNTIRYPGLFDETITVGSIDRFGVVQGDSSRGRAIDVVAPGVGIFSTALGRTYGYGTGTSFAAPFVTGIAALILAKHRKTGVHHLTPVETVDQMRDHLIKMSIDLGAPGFDTTFGYGLPVFRDTISLRQVMTEISLNDFTPTGRKKLYKLLTKLNQS